jgi:hypothetical protein
LNLFFRPPNHDPDIKATLVPLPSPFPLYFIFLRSHTWMLSADGASTMAFFSSGSRALVEILTRMQSAERPMPVDHTFFEFGSIRYHVEVIPFPSTFDEKHGRREKTIMHLQKRCRLQRQILRTCTCRYRRHLFPTKLHPPPPACRKPHCRRRGRRTTSLRRSSSRPEKGTS